MIKISKKIWWVKGVDRQDNLAYMCPYEETKEGEVLSNVSKMQATGRNWASVGPRTVWKTNQDGSYIRDEKGLLIQDHTIPSREGEEDIAENNPISGFYVGNSVARWSTSNKLFRVKDPRGFTVEIPTDNLATLLHHTTVVKGFVQEECVWGREGNSHILLPVNSEPYLETLDKMDTLSNKLISIKELKVGDWVKFFEDNKDYYYFGKIKVTWKITPYNSSYSGYGGQRKETFGETKVVKDSKWIDVFLYKYDWDKQSSYYSSTTNKPKIVKIIKNEKIDIDKNSLGLYVPDRVTNQVYTRGDWYYHKSEIVEIEVK